MSRSLLIATLAINIFCVAALLWSLTERTHLTIVSDGTTVSALVDGARVSAPAGGRTGGQVGIYLEGPIQPTPDGWLSAGPNLSWITSSPIVELLLRLGVESAWGEVTVTDQTTGTVIWRSSEGGWQRVDGAWYAAPDGGLTTSVTGTLLAGGADWTNYRVDADLVRGRVPAGIVFGADGTKSGLFFYFRPAQRDAMWWSLENGRWIGPITSSAPVVLNRTLAGGAQALIRLALGGYPAAVALVVAAIGLGGVERRWLGRAGRRKRPSTPLVDPAAGAGGGLAAPAPAASPVAMPLLASMLATEARGAARMLPGPFALGMAIWATFAGAYVSDQLLQRLPHVQDSVAYLFQARTFALGRIAVPAPPLPDFFAHEFILFHSGLWFSKYPPGFPMVLALGVLAHAPWMVNPIATGLGVLVVYRLGKEIYDARVGLIAALLALVSPFILFLSGSMMAHPTGLLFTLLFAWLFWRASRSERPLWPAIGAGVAFGMDFLIRPWSALTIGGPFVVFALVALGCNPRDALRRFLPVLLAAIPVGAITLVYNRALTGSPFVSPQVLWWSFDTLGFGPTHGPNGFWPIDGLHNTNKNMADLLNHLYGWPAFMTLSFALVPFLIGRSRRWDWMFLGGAAALIGGYALWWADGTMYGPRFYFEGVGFLLLLTARGIAEVADLARRGIHRRATRLDRVAGAHEAFVAPKLVYLLVITLIAYNAVVYMPWQWQLYHGYNYVNRDSLDAVQAAGIHNAVIFVDTGKWYEWWTYGSVFTGNDPLLTNDVLYARDLGDKDADLMRLYPGRSFYKLSGAKITPIGK